MAVKSIGAYPAEVKDALENFHGNQLVYIGWDQHLMFAGANAYPLPPSMPFQALIDQVLPEGLGAHPEFAQIDWGQVEWTLDGERITPNPAASLQENGIGHKSLLTFVTPGLTGYQGSGT